MRPELELNRARWDEATRLHTRGNVYGIEDFLAGQCRLHRVEVEELGDVRGKHLLHLQCHFGLDTLSWARRGAHVTGVDFSPEGIAAARKLSQQAGLAAEFVCSNLYALREQLDRRGSYDIVYTSYGVLNWLPDVQGWAETIFDYLKPGGSFYIVESHPVAHMFPTDEDLQEHPVFQPCRSYFHNPAGIHWPAGLDYADNSQRHEVDCHEWTHSLADVVGALLKAGLSIEHLHEFPYCSWQVVAECEVVERFSSSHAYYGLPASRPQLPLMFSIRARRPV